jgi:flagellar basal-body rod protein FlgG
MINSLQIAKTGMQAQQTQLDVISNNLANVSTTGFKRSTALFEDLMYQNWRPADAGTADAPGLPTGLQLGLGVRTVATSRTFSQGTLQQTEKAFDVAINGDGFFQVNLPNGEIGYTRDGSFSRNSTGQLVNANGYTLVGPTAIPTGATDITITAGGQVSAKVGGTVTQYGAIQTASFINPSGLNPIGKNIFTVSTASGDPVVGTPGLDGLGDLMQGYLESSNVNVVQELVNMIQTQRAYEVNSKAIKASDEMLQKLGQL